jgi:hypothetical protein
MIQSAAGLPLENARGRKVSGVFAFGEDYRGKMAKFLNRARQQLIDTEWPKIHSRRQTDFRLHVFEILAERFACMCQLEIRIVKNMDYAYNLIAT